MTNWPWTVWVQRRFAKPADTGSIPATASMFRALYNQPWMGGGHRFQLGQRFGDWAMQHKTAFWAGVRQSMRFGRPIPPPYDPNHATKLMIEKHFELIDTLTKLSELKDKHKAMSIELSKLKRASK